VACQGSAPTSPALNEASPKRASPWRLFKDDYSGTGAERNRNYDASLRLNRGYATAHQLVFAPRELCHKRARVLVL
jgi:hypothetical protein